MFVSAIVLAAGKGSRFGSRVPKPFVDLAGRQVLEHSLLALKGIRCIRQFIVTASPQTRERARKALSGAGLDAGLVVNGGRRRQDSVRNALSAVDPRAGFVLVHDAARPLVTAGTVSAVIRAARRSGAALAAVPVKATIKQAKTAAAIGRRVTVGKTLDRSLLWEAQTPQAFRIEVILHAYRRSDAVTDDASLVEKLGRRVELVEGEYSNIKITTPEDLVIAAALIRKRSRRPGP